MHVWRGLLYKYFDGRLKGSFDEIISAVDDFFVYQWDPSTTTRMAEVYGSLVGVF